MLADGFGMAKANVRGVLEFGQLGASECGCDRERERLDDERRSYGMNSLSVELTIREFEPGDEAAFRRLNEEWITRYFVIEPKDEYTLANPQTTILDHGGRIFFAMREGEAVGCCALIAMGPGEFEVAKMAVQESQRGAGIGRRLLERVIEEARTVGVQRLYLETNKKLTPAIRLYESLGFQHIPPEKAVPSPYARANVPMELLLTS
jgi:putative acetyltransferase